MIRYSSFRLANALLGLLVIMLTFFGLPRLAESILFIIFGLLIILFSLAEGGSKSEPSLKDSSASENPTL